MAVLGNRIPRIRDQWLFHCARLDRSGGIFAYSVEDLGSKR